MDQLTGRLPEGWRRNDLGVLCGLDSGASIPSSRRAEHGVPLLLARHLAGRRVRHEEPVHVPDGAAERLARFRLRPGDLVLTRSGTVGRCALIGPDEDGWLFSDLLVRIRPREPALSPYLVQYLTLASVQGWIQRHATQATIPSITLRTLRGLPVALPPPDVRRRIGEALGALDEKIRVHEEISRTTAELRAVMAELLMTGELPALRNF